MLRPADPMDFLIAATFTDSLIRLTGDEQKAAKTAAFDLQINPASPGLSFHKLDKAKDKNFWSVRVNADIRLIVHRTEGSLLLRYVNHHDKAYDWAERRKLETHPKTGAAQLVEIRETVKEVIVPVYVQTEMPAAPKPRLFADRPDEELLGYGVPAEWLNDVRQANEDSLLLLADRLPGEASEALLELATGGKPRVPKPAQAVTNPFDHPDAQRRFRVMTNVEELQRALDFPWEKWTIFLHPEQRQGVEHDYTGPARVSGSAGTGKTIVALHRAVHLARAHPEARVLLTTFSDTLANALHTKLKRLVGGEPRLAERIDVYSLAALGLRLYKSHCGPVNLARREVVRELLGEASKVVGGHKFSLHFLLTEWEQVVDAWQLGSWESYRDVTRLGRRTRLPEARRKVLWSIFEQLRGGLEARKLITHAGLFTSLASALAKGKPPPFDFAVVDEAQDISVAHLRFFAALGADRPNALFFAPQLVAAGGFRCFGALWSGNRMKTIRHTATLFYYDGPQVFEARDAIGGHYVAVMVEPEGAQDDRPAEELALREARSKPSNRSISEGEATPLVSLLSGVSNLGSEPVTLLGTLEEVDVTRLTWRIATPDGKYSGEVNQGGPSLVGLTTGSAYRFDCIEEIQEVEGTGREQRTLYLIEHRPV